MLKFNHSTAWEGDDCDVIRAIFVARIFSPDRRITSINIPGFGAEPQVKSFCARASLVQCFFIMNYIWRKVIQALVRSFIIIKMKVFT